MPGEYSSSLAMLPGTEGYEDYLEEDLYYHEAYKVSEDGTEYWCFDICLPRFAENMEILNCSEQETRELVADFVYGYFISQGEEYVLRETYLCFEPRDFYMLEQGLGVYYPRYAIDCGAAGDFLFIIPYEELGGI